MCSIHWWALLCCGKALQVEGCHVEFHTTGCRSCWERRSIKSVCRGKSHLTGFKDCWVRKTANALSLNRLLDGGRCSVGVATAMVPYVTSHNIIQSLKKHVLWQHGTSERNESDNGTHFQICFIDIWAEEHGWHWAGVSHPLSHSSCWEDWMLQWPAKNYPESNRSKAL